MLNDKMGPNSIAKSQTKRNNNEKERSLQYHLLIDRLSVSKNYIYYFDPILCPSLRVNFLLNHRT